jgi:hypothetical protein
MRAGQSPGALHFFKIMWFVEFALVKSLYAPALPSGQRHLT